MIVIMAFVIGGLFAAAVYMMTRRSISRMIIGLVLMGHAANLLILTAAGLRRGRAPLVPLESIVLTGTVTDPLPQALILTAIVISFSVLAFTVVLFHRTIQTTGIDDLYELRSSEEP